MRKFYIVLGFLVLIVPKVEAQSVPYTKNSAGWWLYVEALSRGDRQVLNFGCGSLAEVMNKTFGEMHMNDCRDIGKHASTLEQIDCPTDAQKVARIVDNKVTSLVDTASFANQKCRRDSVYGHIEFAESGALILGPVQTAPPRITASTKTVVVGKNSPKTIVPPVNTIVKHDTLWMHDTTTLYHRDTLRIETEKRVEVLVPQQGKPCWRFALTKCTFWTGLGLLAGGVGTGIAICHNPPNKVYTVCGGEPNTTNIYNVNTHHIVVTSKAGTRGRSIRLRASVPTSVIFNLLGRK